MTTRCLMVKMGNGVPSKFIFFTELTFYTRTPPPSSDREHNFLSTYPSPKPGPQTCTFELGLWGWQFLPKEAYVP